MKSSSVPAIRVAVIGAGPAGLAAAVSAAAQGAEVVVFEPLPEPGRRLLATGGGHCNFTNILAADDLARRFGSCARFVLPSFRSTDSDKLREFFTELGVPSHSPDGFHVFPVSNSAIRVRDALVAACERRGVKFRFVARATGLGVADGRMAWVEAGGLREKVNTVVLAAGGASRPELGGGNSGIELAATAGHAIVDCSPALVPLVTREQWPGTLAGVTIPQAVVRCDAAGTQSAGKGALLFTHRGISGPAVLDVSGAVVSALRSFQVVPIHVDLAPHMTPEQWRLELDGHKKEHGTRVILSVLRLHLPAALARAVLDVAGVPADVTMSRMSADQRSQVIRCMVSLPLTVTGTDGMRAAMVSRGGVSLTEIDRKTLESKLVGGLFFAGEVMDVDGPCGGFNLHWAFASGLLAGAGAGRSN